MIKIVSNEVEIIERRCNACLSEDNIKLVKIGNNSISNSIALCYNCRQELLKRLKEADE